MPGCGARSVPKAYCPNLFLMEVVFVVDAIILASLIGTCRAVLPRREAGLGSGSYCVGRRSAPLHQGYLCTIR